MCSLGCCSQCCALISLFGIFFLLSLGSMFDSQPFYTDLEILHEHEDGHASTNCYFAGGIYACTLVLSLIGLWYDKQRQAKRALTMGNGNGGATFGDGGIAPMPIEVPPADVLEIDQYSTEAKARG